MAFDEHNRETVLEASPPALEGRRPRAVLPRIQPLPADEAHPEPPASGDAAAGAPPAEGTDHFGDALHLVRAASDALERMRARYREVETYAAQQADYYRSELAMAHAGIRDLQEQNLAREETIQRLEAQVRAEADQRRSLEEALKTISEAAERLREQAQHAEARAASAEAWLGRFQGEIATAFGEIPRLLGEIDQTGETSAEQHPRVAASR
jgi:hypothetical protein